MTSDIVTNMYFKSKKIPLLILGVTAMLSSRTMFVSFDDPEGPNLLIISVLALIVYFLTLSLTVYLFKLPITRLKGLLVTIFLQVLTVTVLFFLLR